MNEDLKSIGLRLKVLSFEDFMSRIQLLMIVLIFLTTFICIILYDLELASIESLGEALIITSIFCVGGIFLADISKKNVYDNKYYTCPYCDKSILVFYDWKCDYCAKGFQGEDRWLNQECKWCKREKKKDQCEHRGCEKEFSI